MIDIKKLTVEQYEFMKIFIDSSKTVMINEILLSLPYLNNINMYELAVSCLHILADMSSDEYFELVNEIYDEITNSEDV